MPVLLRYASANLDVLIESISVADISDLRVSTTRDRQEPQNPKAG
jgi:hypothetical protein